MKNNILLFVGHVKSHILILFELSPLNTPFFLKKNYYNII